MSQTFNETEKIAIATVILKLIVADKTLEKRELQFLHGLYTKYDIPHIIPAEQRQSYDQAIECINAMELQNKETLRTILNDLANADNDFDTNEIKIIEEILP